MQQRFLYVTAASSFAMMSAAVHGQTFQSTGTDFSPAGVNGQVVTNAHNDATGVDTANVRVSAYAFNADPEDPNFTQDPGFNAPANSGLPAGSTLSFSVLDSLKFWNGVGPVNLGATANRETLQYAFGSASITLSSSSGPQSGFNIGAVSSNGALHKHLNAFLYDGNGNDQPGATPTQGIYVAQLRLNNTALASSPSIFTVYSDNASQAAVDRAKFYIRNHSAPGSNILGNLTSLIGLSAQPGESNLATGGEVTVSRDGSGQYRSEVDPLTTNANKGSVVINQIAPAYSETVLLYLNGSSGDIASLIGNLNVPESYQIALANDTSSPLYAESRALQASYPGFSALAKFTPTAENTAFTWDFSANPNVTVDQLAVVPEPAAISLIGLGSVLARRRRRNS